MRALVTGSAGFLGRHFCVELVRRGWEVAGCDLVDGNDCLELFRDGAVRYDLVVHAAAYEPHRAAIEGAVDHLARNLHLDAAMFLWVERTGQRRVLYLSSSAAYPVGYQAGRVPYRLAERDADTSVAVSAELLRALGGTGPIWPDAAYGWAKLTGERMAARANQAGVAVHVVRPFSGYGEDQGERWPFGAFAARARRRDDPFVIWGPGSQVRDWVHVDDVVAAALAVIDADVRTPVNICTGTGTSVMDLASLMCAEVGYRPSFECKVDAPVGVAYRVGDPTLLNMIYTAKVALAEGVARAMAQEGALR